MTIGKSIDALKRHIGGLAQQTWIAYAVAVAGTAVAAWLRVQLGTMVGETLPFYITFYAVIMLSAILGGFKPGLLATVLATASVIRLYIAPSLELGEFDASEIAGLIIFCGVNVMISIIGGAFRAARLRTKTAAEELATTVERLRLAIKAGEIGIFETDFAAARMRFSPEFCRILGLPPGTELSPEESRRLVHPDDRERVMKDFSASRDPASTGATRLEFRMLRPDGSVRWIALSGHTFFNQTPDGLVASHALGAAVDITERKQAETEILSLNRSLETLVVERTALAEQRAEKLRLLAGDLARAEQKERDHLAQVLHDHLQPLLVGIRMRLEAAENDTKRNKLEQPQPLSDLPALLTEAINCTRSLSVELSPPVLREKGLKAALEWLQTWAGRQHSLQINLEADDAAEPADDTTRMLCFQTVRELLLNVVKHSGVDKARISTKAGSNGQTLITVADQGKGFNPTTPRHHKESGTGFGLTSMEQRLNMVGATLKIESAPGHGTAITLMTRPTASTPSRPADSSATPPAGSKRIRLLVVDDYATLRESIIQALDAQEDLTVVGAAGDGRKAVELARELHPDVVLMDARLPQLDGPEAARQIMRDRPGTKIIAFSMHEESLMGNAMRQAGAVAYVNKADSLEFLIDVIRQCYKGTVLPSQ